MDGVFAAFLVSLITLVPLVVVLASVLSPELEIWQHLREHVLPDLLLNTLYLVVGVGLLSGFLGVSLAWLISVCEFPGRRFFLMGLDATFGDASLCSRICDDRSL